MPNFTREAIKKSFWKLLNERPLNQITVKDIVDDCGINRNSFYYHFQDLPSLTEEISEQLITKAIEEHPSVESFEECLEIIINFVIENKRAAYHIYNSVDHSILEKYLLDICEYAIKTYTDTALSNLNIPDEKKKMIIKYHQCEFFGQIIQWLNNGMKYDILTDLHRFCIVSKKITEQIINTDI